MREAEARGLVTLMTGLIKSYGPPKAPKVPSPLRAAPQLSDIFKSDFNSQPIADWAEGVFTQIKFDLGMENWPVTLKNGSGAPTSHRNIAPKSPAQYSLIQPYYESRAPGATMEFDPERCHIPGYFAVASILTLSEIKWRASGGAKLTSAQEAIMTLTSAAYSGQGFLLLPLKRRVRNHLASQTSHSPLNKAKVQNTLLFTACLGLRALNRSPEQIIAAYGCLVSPKVRQKIRLTCQQIDGFEAELDLLQKLSAPRRQSPLGMRHANVA
ncbi:hypothetical protein [Litorimonas haliclonae]|uniref:hypothetical protein n=1 Tax=Litorimonas haliclonae TaxID=2081977 RepID=UPI0039F06B07